MLREIGVINPQFAEGWESSFLPSAISDISMKVNEAGAHPDTVKILFRILSSLSRFAVCPKVEVKLVSFSEHQIGEDRDGCGINVESVENEPSSFRVTLSQQGFSLVYKVILTIS